MKIRILTIVMLFSFGEAFSQITVTHNDVISVGDNINEAIDTVASAANQLAISGANQTWDFSNLLQQEINQIIHVDPISTTFGALHPTSNICAIGDGENIYFNKTANGIEIVGFDDTPLFNPILAIPLPLTYPMQHTTGHVLALNEIEPNAFFPDSLAPLVSLGAAHKVDSISVQITLESTYNVDSYGDVILPMGTFPSLRVFVENTNTQTISMHCTDTILGIGTGWYAAPQQLIPTEVETDYYYQWWSNDPSVKMGLINIDVDEYGDDFGEIRFLTSGLTTIEEESSLVANIFPIPATNSLSIEIEENLLTEIFLKDISGKLISQIQSKGSTTLSLNNINSGIYSLTLKSDEKQLTKKVIIK